MTYEVQQSRWDRLVRRVSGSIGPGSRVSETLSELFPVMDVERMPSELLALGGTKLCVGAAKQVGVAAQRSRIQLFNPVDSGNIITVTHVTVSALAGDFCNMAVRGIPLTINTALNRFRDGRFPAPGRPVGQIRSQTSVAQTDPDGFIQLTAQVAAQLSDPNDLAVLPPGSGFELGLTTVQVDLRVSFRWRERPAEASELSL